MRLSQTFVKTKKQISWEEKSINAQLLQKAWFIHQLMAWVYSYLPMGFRVFKKIEAVVRDEMVKAWWEEVFLPSLQPKANWEQTWRWDTVDVLFKFTSFYTQRELALWSTHEEIVTPLLKDYVVSYKDLPRYVFQIQNKFRDEKRAKSWILRAREFVMKDLYSFHTSQEDLDRYYEIQKQAYINIYNRLWIWDITYLTFASWWTFSKYSHEFQTITDAWEDLIYLCEKCKVAINKEIIEEQKVCPECWNADLKEIKAIEVWNIFKLWSKFSDSFGFKYMDENNQEKPVIMWCYGIGLWRLMWAVVEASNDEKWIIWPEQIAPYKYVLVPIWNKWVEKWEEIYNYFIQKWEEIVIDDRNESPGFKFKDADLVWYPYQIVVSEKTLENWDNFVELVNRKTWEKKLIDYKKI